MSRLSAPGLSGPAPEIGVGMVVPYDMALDREMWRWVPQGVSLLFNRTPFAALPVTVEMAERVSDAQAVRNGVTELKAVSPAVVAYGCTSGSFVHGLSGERALTETMVRAGAPAAVTTSGALLAALRALGVSRVGVATPYDAEVTDRLALFLGEARIEVTASAHLGLTADIWKVPYARTAELVCRADSDDAQAIVVSCTNLPTYDAIAPLEQVLGKPVITANQVTVWAALEVVHRQIVGPGQRLADVRPAIA